MNRKTTYIVELCKILLICATVPLYYVKLFCDRAVLPGYNADGEHITSTFYHYYSVADKFDREGVTHLIWAAITGVILSVTLSALNMIIKDKITLKVVSHTVFIITLLFSLALICFASLISYAY